MATAAILRLNTAMSANSAGTMVSDSSVSVESSGISTNSMPASSTSADRIGSRPFMIMVCTAKLSAVMRYIRSPTFWRLWKASDRRCRWL